MPEEDDDLARVLDEDMPLPLLTWAATLAVARRLDLPIFSDDRYVRLSARQMGLPAFGTVALLDVLADRRIISDDLREVARKRLLASRAVGL